MLPHTTAQVIGIPPILLSWIAAAVIFHRTPTNPAHAISVHSAKTKINLLIFALALTLYAVTYSWAAIGWLMPHYSLPGIFTVIVILATICVIATAYIPASSGLSYRLHGIAAYSMAGLMPVILLLIAAGKNTAYALRVSCVIAALVMVFLLILFATVPAVRRHYLWYQSVYILSFQLVTVLAFIK